MKLIQGSEVAPARRSSRAETLENIRKIVGNMSPAFRQQILEEALRHFGCNGEYEVARITAKNLRIPERVVSAVIVLSWLELRSRLATLETGLRGAMIESVEAGRAVWRDVA